MSTLIKNCASYKNHSNISRIQFVSENEHQKKEISSKRSLQLKNTFPPEMLLLYLVFFPCYRLSELIQSLNLQIVCKTCVCLYGHFHEFSLIGKYR